MENREAKINLHFENLKKEISNILTDVTADLQVYKSAFALSENRLKDLEKEIAVLKGSDRRVICLVDGDGVIFLPDLISQGRDGGQAAATKLVESIRREFKYKFELDLDQMHLWVHVFYNKRGLMSAIGKAGYSVAMQKLEDFVHGFNRAADRFVMVDVGPGKEAADVKIKVMLEDNIRLSQTCKILFGGCHDNGYVTSLCQAITAGFEEKLILLRGYKVSAAGIDQLGLPSISIPELFIQDELVTSPQDHFPEEGPNSLANTVTNHAQSLGPPSYKSVAQAGRPVQNYAGASEFDTASNTSTNTNDKLINNRPSPSSRLRRVNPHIPLSKHDPPPCTLFYIAHCKHGDVCVFGHNYILEDEHYKEIREGAKKKPCPAINRGEVCTFGDNCCYGHVCLGGPGCYFKAIGSCRFVGANMHKKK